MSWLAKVQARAERLLEQVDQTAAKKLGELGVSNSYEASDFKPRIRDNSSSEEVAPSPPRNLKEKEDPPPPKKVESSVEVVAPPPKTPSTRASVTPATSATPSADPSPPSSTSSRSGVASSGLIASRSVLSDDQLFSFLNAADTPKPSVPSAPSSLSRASSEGSSQDKGVSSEPRSSLDERKPDQRSLESRTSSAAPQPRLSVEATPSKQLSSFSPDDELSFSPVNGPLRSSKDIVLDPLDDVFGDDITIKKKDPKKEDFTPKKETSTVQDTKKSETSPQKQSSPIDTKKNEPSRPQNEISLLEKGHSSPKKTDAVLGNDQTPMKVEDVHQAAGGKSEEDGWGLGSGIDVVVGEDTPPKKQQDEEKLEDRANHHQEESVKSPKERESMPDKREVVGGDRVHGLHNKEDAVTVSPKVGKGTSHHVEQKVEEGVGKKVLIKEMEITSTNVERRESLVENSSRKSLEVPVEREKRRENEVVPVSKDRGALKDKSTTVVDKAEEKAKEDRPKSMDKDRDATDSKSRDGRRSKSFERDRDVVADKKDEKSREDHRPKTQDGHLKEETASVVPTKPKEEPVRPAIRTPSMYEQQLLMENNLLKIELRKHQDELRRHSEEMHSLQNYLKAEKERHEEAKASIREFQSLIHEKERSLQDKDKVIQQQHAEWRALQRQQEQEFSTALGAKEAQQRELRTRLEEVLSALKNHESTLETIRAERDQLLLNQHSVLEAQAAALRQVRLAEEERERMLNQEKNAHMTTQLQARDREIALETEHTTYVKALASMQRAMEEKQAEVTRRESQVRWLETACEALKQEIADAEALVDREKTKCSQQVNEANNRLTEVLSGRDVALRELETLRKQLVEKETQLKQVERKMTSQRSGASGMAEMEARLHTMAEHLLQKQSQLELLTSQKQALQLQLEDVTKRAKQAEIVATSSSRRPYGFAHEGDVVEDSTGVRQRGVSKFVKTVEKFDLPDNSRFRKPAEVMDALSLHLGDSLRSNPTARVALFFYIIIMHLWILFMFSSWQSRITPVESINDLRNDLHKGAFPRP
mmetsp:Transcript_33214/g.53870  ORF Transcript_33214/g.53870 Transcript_33214/m.53870 type:complete len:1048 (-) Transcript_33214:105-3248(-)|eukprot:CAMPEP_0184672544 /NCGR_PEP_ID=MMETSP0308-20130426/86158_1 /TAXON_ID=38269 /ORGANISM="Gloeochaete witrockiana, Strain SAG 46.84" /LENGTH=1047 /DNA_ID=CAMNT_0027119883 /DNA_START=46 /DNA_END=3189 /DNA_ORIENTATION=-